MCRAARRRAARRRAARRRAARRRAARRRRCRPLVKHDDRASSAAAAVGVVVGNGRRHECDLNCAAWSGE